MGASESISSQSIPTPNSNKIPESVSSPNFHLNPSPPYHPDHSAGEASIPMFNISLQNLNLKEKDPGTEEAQAENDKKDSNEEDNLKSESEVSNEEIDNVNETEKVGDDDGDGGEERSGGADGNGNRRYQYPLRPEAGDCAYYMKSGTCKFGLNCKFNHPVRRKNQVVKERTNEREELTQKPGQTECKYYLSTGGCKFGNACRYNHTAVKTSAVPIIELNFLGLPIRQGEKECSYYMRHGSCKYATNCRFNHPDPTAMGGCDSPSGYGNGGSVYLQGASQSAVTTWSSPRALNETAPFVPMMFSPSQGVPSQNSEWNGYQAPVYLPERSMHPPPAYVMNNPASEINVYTHNQQQSPLDEFPERPGQPECSYYIKTGACKFKYNCKYHHPKNRISMPPPCTLSDKGLPSRPDQNVCTHYSRYGICKFGPACKFDHPVQSAASTASGMDQPSPFGN